MNAPVNNTQLHMPAAIDAWTRRQGGSAELAAWAAQAALADRSGNSAVPMSDAEHARIGEDALMVCKDPPFVFDLGFFYLKRNHAHEKAVAAALRQRLDSAVVHAPVDSARLTALFGPGGDGADQPQRDAVSAVRGKPLFVLTGGPGTGKTTTVLRMLLQLDHEFRATQTRAPRIVCCAPTGKAAQRLKHALMAGADALLLRGDAFGFRESVDNVLADEPSTVHRFLGELERGVRMQADIVVLDEASMLDLAMMDRLLGRLDPQTRLVLVGDANQLASVETGSAFSDLVQALRARQSPALVELRHSFRALPQLQAMNEAAGTGDSAGFEAAILASHGLVQRQTLERSAALSPVLTAWAGALARAADQARIFEPLPRSEEEQRVRIQTAHRALGERQLLCAVHQGAYGTIRCNAVIEEVLRARAGFGATEAWYPGRAVLVSRNDYALGLYNGDVGICMQAADGELNVWFLRLNADGGVTPLGLPTHALPVHSAAFAISIHKAQGSEYPEVAVLLPGDEHSASLTRQLLYTAVSRAKKQLHLWSSEAALATALHNNVARVGALGLRLTS